MTKEIALLFVGFVVGSWSVAQWTESTIRDERAAAVKAIRAGQQMAKNPSPAACAAAASRAIDAAAIGESTR